jgi:hypothetical protein
MRMKRVIYLIYFMILISAIFYRTVKADSTAVNKKIINKITVNKVKNGTEVVIGLNGKIRPESVFYPKENSVVLDFSDTKALKDLPEAFVAENLKLGCLTSSDNKTRVKLYSKEGSRMSLVYSGNDVIVRIKSNSKTTQMKSGLLVHPSEKKFSQAILSLNDSLFEPLVKELANEAEIDLRLGDDVPERISANFETSTPFEALRNIAYENNLKFYRDGTVWYLSGT